MVAEGVETRGQFDFLKAQRCDLLQGYYFSRPLLADDFAHYLKASLVTRPDGTGSALNPTSHSVSVPVLARGATKKPLISP